MTYTFETIYAVDAYVLSERQELSDSCESLLNRWKSGEISICEYESAVAPIDEKMHYLDSVRRAIAAADRVRLTTIRRTPFDRKFSLTDEESALFDRAFAAYSNGKKII